MVRLLEKEVQGQVTICSNKIFIATYCYLTESDDCLFYYKKNNRQIRTRGLSGYSMARNAYTICLRAQVGK